MSAGLYRPMKQIPHTPNLQEEKQKGKSNSRRKQVLNQMAISPTSKMIRQATQSKLLYEKLQQTVQRYESTPCMNHPQFKGKYFFEGNVSKRFCLKCKMLLGCDSLHPQRIEKMYGLGQFKTRVQECTHKALCIEEGISKTIAQEQERIQASRASIVAYMANIRQLIEEKENQLLSSLDNTTQQLQRMRMDTLNDTNEIKKSFMRYVKDIDGNFEDIMTELSLEHYEDILLRYNAKLDHQSAELDKMKMKIPLNYVLCMPIHEVEKAVRKIALSVPGRKQENKYQIKQYQSKQYQSKQYSKYQDNKNYNKYDSRHYRRGSKENIMLNNNDCYK